ncbi:hypothetical protein GCM10011352_04710 [Marinobacterium zhoushanense]|uniref:Uncharacterized protein n=2 Tax=Marinobacterium zhoushanense TaxID=1679163 RepID=A0ABQ1K2M4_9GAMM|nr:hypothetical protein GCM10011352_04710 [Marinobacterium zhoushanense]
MANFRGGIKELLKNNSNDKFLIIGSKNYLDLITNDINDSIEGKIIKPENIIVISAKEASGQLRKQTLKANPELRHYFKCTMANLNYRIANEILAQKADFDIKSFQNVIDKIKVLSPPRKKIANLSDEEIKEKVIKILTTHGNDASSKTKALSIFRNKYNLSCSAERFTPIYKFCKSKLY